MWGRGSGAGGAAGPEERGWRHRASCAALARELRRIGVPGQAVDLGAGGGAHTRVLLDHGWEAVALDESEAAVEAARERGLDAHRADPRFLPLPSAECDLVLALEVLQRAEDDRAVMAEIARVLRPGGVALVGVPADPGLWSTHDVWRGHVRRYTRQDLSALAAYAGLAVDRMWSRHVLIRPVVAWRRRRLIGCDPEQAVPLLDTALTAVTGLERYLPVSSLPGVSLLARLRQRSGGRAEGPAPALVYEMGVAGRSDQGPVPHRP